MTIQEFERYLCRYNISLYYSDTDVISTTTSRVAYYKFVYGGCEFFIQANRGYLNNQFFKNIFTRQSGSFVFKNIDLFKTCEWVDKSIIYFIDEDLFLNILKDDM